MINEQDSDNSSDLSEEEETVFKAENHRSRSEYMTMKQVNNFKQENLETHSIMMLDFESEVYIWVGSLVPKDKLVSCFEHCINALRSVHSKAKRRRDKIAFSLTF